jgi:low temperature requirement protein LtrA
VPVGSLACLGGPVIEADEDSGGDRQNSRGSGDRSSDALELFFDLVLTYAMSQVTHLMLADISWRGFGHGVLALFAVWWAWTCYAWLTNTSAAASAAARIMVLLAMAAMLVAAIALPQAFARDALVFACALLGVRILHVVLYLLSVRNEPRLRTAVRRLTPGLVASPALIVAAAFAKPPFRELLWVAAAALDAGGPLVAGVAGFQVLPRHFVERHGAIIIIALGEAIVSVGAGAGEDLQGLPVLAAVILGVLICALLWWSYFGLTTKARQRLTRAQGEDRARLARDAYSYLHFPLVAGIVFFALGVYEAIARPQVPLDLLPAAALCGGVALFFAADVAYRWRDHHKLAHDRLTASVAALAVLPLAVTGPPLAALIALAVIGAVRALWEALHPGLDRWIQP